MSKAEAADTIVIDHTPTKPAMSNRNNRKHLRQLDKTLSTCKKVSPFRRNASRLTRTMMLETSMPLPSMAETWTTPVFAQKCCHSTIRMVFPNGFRLFPGRRNNSVCRRVRRTPSALPWWKSWQRTPFQEGIKRRLPDPQSQLFWVRTSYGRIYVVLVPPPFYPPKM